ncbi:DNA primase noncatalytic subunit PriX [Sulfolobus sp. S-194]|uniref:DNA primase noncatalytic subunit PriX n=1 Tax=Sulfolobus sp. S-194 TaxID=2512240 RepID=UPI001437144D|nr:DNA primase noncatalytic subunit PriX [Sulfolobus sp. S-194]QIW23495.1 DNA primase noncatalytic subunit PriX [Sulfolobus sp. S-194]
MKVKIFLHYPDDTPAGYVIFDGKTSKVYDENGNLLFEVEGIFPPKLRKINYEWVDKVLDEGLEDARKRFILYVGSRYLVNIKGLSEDEAIKRLEDFYYKKGGGKIYESWLKSVLRGVKNKGLKPWSLKRIQEKDKEMYSLISKVLNKQT